MTRVAAFVTALLFLTAGCSGGKNAAPQPPPATLGSTTSSLSDPRQLRDLHDIRQLRSLFNTDSGEPRLILLASPT